LDSTENSGLQPPTLHMQVMSGADALPPSLDELYDLTYRPVRQRCWRILGNSHDAEDAVQEVYRRATERILEIEQPLHWMLRVATNVCHDELRRRRRESHAMDREGSRLQGSPLPDATELVSEPAVLSRFLDRLSPGERAVVVRRWLNGVTLEEAAGELGISSSTARNLLLRARRKIGAELQRYCAGLGAIVARPVTALRWRARRSSRPSLGLSRQLSTQSGVVQLGWLAAVAVPIVVAALLPAAPAPATGPPRRVLAPPARIERAVETEPVQEVPAAVAPAMVRPAAAAPVRQTTASRPPGPARTYVPTPVGPIPVRGPGGEAGPKTAIMVQLPPINPGSSSGSKPPPPCLGPQTVSALVCVK